MARSNPDRVTWIEDPEEVIYLVNRSQENFILHLPTGQVRLDVGRRIRTLRSIAKVDQVRKLLDAGKVAIEKK
ncbi:MAG: hypothetical protein D6790_03175 [Caldilineae bacterium]|nr:MAG: hypothetical protein D6790_03175 [Caldilineae bacterium]